MPPSRDGMVLGKFLPPHRGHRYLIDYARGVCDRLCVVVGSLEAEPIPGAQRVAWMRELFPDVEVVHCQDENPQLPHEHPDFWRIWRESLLRVAPFPPHLLFAGEDYGARLAAELGARWVPLPGGRALLPTSGTAVRGAPGVRWADLPSCVRPWYLKRVCVLGPESTGKTTLARDLAADFDTVWVPEAARALLEAVGGEVDPEVFEWIARCQPAAEDALARRARQVLFCDTDLLLTTLWHEVLVGPCPAWLWEAARARRYDLYLVTDVDVPWVEDPVRYLPEERQGFLDRCLARLEQEGRRFVRLSGTWDQRRRAARQAVQALLEDPPPSAGAARA